MTIIIETEWEVYANGDVAYIGDKETAAWLAFHDWVICSQQGNGIPRNARVSLYCNGNEIDCYDV